MKENKLNNRAVNMVSCGLADSSTRDLSLYSTMFLLQGAYQFMNKLQFIQLDGGGEQGHLTCVVSHCFATQVVCPSVNTVKKSWIRGIMDLPSLRFPILVA